ncbi:MAG: bifunctional phosphopantothenoylcysteine decarboxylase/phosphopantothenate--cysteine ligase CoaBC [Saprospiraceae bacterium]|nr:bifunctional phosphopantothenoylcysteine decarboxylase/phosphopantothenate--cysteine ligase CoaBC [Saprospiraceae bacterium]
MPLQGKKIIVGITGSIAAYKAAMLVRLLVKGGAEVQVLMTEAAKEFISPLTMSTLSKRPVFSEMFSEDGWNNHVDMGLWADAFVIAPATATTLSKMAKGQSDNILLATFLSAKCPVFFAPAMDLDMWAHPSTKENIQKLQEFGHHYIQVGDGELASGLSGEGRMAEPENIGKHLVNFFHLDLPLTGKKVVVTGGPTYEALDPVRFIGNRSSGRMGIAIAEAFAQAGAETTLVLGPTHLSAGPSVRTIRVESAAEMANHTIGLWPETDIAILAAAVADYRPATKSEQKIKKKEGDLSIQLERTTDIAATIGKNKDSGKILIGFALETENELENARRKREKKNFDFIVLNSLQDKGAGFKHDTNKVTFVYENNKEEAFQLKSKESVARDIVNAVIGLINKKVEA